MAFGDDGDVWGDEHTVSDSNGTAIMDAKTVGPVVSQTRFDLLAKRVN